MLPPCSIGQSQYWDLAKRKKIAVSKKEITSAALFYFKDSLSIW